MKEFNLMSAAIVICSFVLGLVSCEKQGGNDDLSNGDELKGYVTENLTLENGRTYYLAGSLQVKSPATLTIEPGVTVIARNNGEINYILIEQGAKINAVGTAENPIVMTSESKKSGAWGGLHICGYSHTNAGSGISEIGNAPYGGQKTDDNSGELKYIRMEYTGYALDEEHEANGISLYGVGNGTKISYIQVLMGSDDGIEFFGGSVNIDHCVVTDCSDDSYDWTEGWNGTAEYIVAYQTPSKTLGYDCDCLMECDNNGSNSEATPVSHPTIRNATLIGNSSDENSRGVRLRAGTRANLENVLISGKKKSVTLQTSQTVQSFADGTSSFKNVAISADFVNEETGQNYTVENFLQGEGNSNNLTFTFKDRFVGMLDGKGAVDEASDWTEGWTL